MNVGVLVEVVASTNVRELFTSMKELGISRCQLTHWPTEESSILNDDAKAEEINAAVKELGITITAFWCGWVGKKVWNLTEGPLTLGLVPEDTREVRTQNLLDGVDFAKKIHVNNIITHAGFIPENSCDPNYPGLLEALKKIVAKCKANDMNFLFETGQETPVTLKRAMIDIETAIGEGNVGVNLDPANIYSYGKGNPIDAVQIFEHYIKGVHGKDGVCRTNPYQVGGHERPMGEGQVNYPLFIQKLKEVGYDGDITIEREISGEEQRKDIVKARKLLEELI